MPSILDAEVSPEHLIYLDVEFTSFQSPQLLSLGLVTGASEEFYAELDMNLPESAAVLGRCSDFVKDTVLPQWGLVPTCSDPRGMAQRVAAWLRSQVREGRKRDSPHTSRPLQIVFDYRTDYELLTRLLKDSNEWSPVLSALVQPLDASELIRRFGPGLAYDQALRSLRSRGLERHHALADALALRAALHPLFTPRGFDK